MKTVLSILIMSFIFIVGCPNAAPIDVGPIPGPPPTPDNDNIIIEVPQKCKIEWEGVVFKNYEALLSQLTFLLANCDCTANDLLCIHAGTGTPCERVWVFPNMDSIPRRTIKDECGNHVVEYLEDSL